VPQVGLVATLQWRSYRDLTKVSFSMSDHEETTAVSQEESGDSRVSSPAKSREEFEEEDRLLTEDWPEGTITRSGRICRSGGQLRLRLSCQVMQL